MVQIAWCVYDDQQNKIKSRNLIIKPKGFAITNSKFHGITNEIIDNPSEQFKNPSDTFLINFNDALERISENSGWIKMVSNGFDAIFRHNIKKLLEFIEVAHQEIEQLL